jgi:hypothetical protein
MIFSRLADHPGNPLLVSDINEGLDSLNDIKREIATTNSLLRALEHGPATQPRQAEAEQQAKPPQQ